MPEAFPETSFSSGCPPPSHILRTGWRPVVLFLQKVPEPPPSKVIGVPGARASLEIQD